MTPPAVLIPRERGGMSRRSKSWVFTRVSRKNGGLDSGTIGDSLIGVDTLAGLLAIEEVAQAW